MRFTIAIDGPAAAGKGTISKAVAAHYGFAHLDTGLLYRAVGARTLDGTDPIEAAKALWGQAAVKVLPGAYLAEDLPDGSNEAAAYIRVALVSDLETTRTGLTRLADTLS